MNDKAIHINMQHLTEKRQQKTSTQTLPQINQVYHSGKKTLV